MEQLYRTSDLMLASFLLAQGLAFRKIENTESDVKRCTFVLAVPGGTNLLDLLSLWSSSETDFLKLVLRKNKILKTELGNYKQLFKN